jgi:hypothetical protein
MTLMKIFTRAAVLSFGFAVAIGAAAEATPLASDRDMVTGVVLAYPQHQGCTMTVGDRDMFKCVHFAASLLVIALVAVHSKASAQSSLEVEVPSASAVSPQRRMFLAAFTSRSWTAPRSSLIPRPAIPLGLEEGRRPHSEQVWVVCCSDTSRSMPPLRNRNFHASICLKRDQPASSTLFAILV